MVLLERSVTRGRGGADSAYHSPPYLVVDIPDAPEDPDNHKPLGAARAPHKAIATETKVGGGVEMHSYLMSR